MQNKKMFGWKTTAVLWNKISVFMFQNRSIFRNIIQPVYIINFDYQNSLLRLKATSDQE